MSPQSFFLNQTAAEGAVVNRWWTALPQEMSHLPGHNVGTLLRRAVRQNAARKVLEKAK